MNYIILLAVLVVLSGITFSEQEQFYPDYCSPKKTNAIKGVFVFLVILFHTEDYFTFGSNDLWVQDLSRMFKQLPVVPFLFYSGFGRTDLGAGDVTLMAASIDKLYSMERDIQVYPGHGTKTTIGREKDESPYLYF